MNTVPRQTFNQFRNGEIGSQIANGAPAVTTDIYNNRNVDPSFSSIQNSDQMQQFHSNVPLPTNTAVQSLDLPGVQAPTSYQSALSNAHQQGRTPSSSSNSYFNVQSANFTAGEMNTVPGQYFNQLRNGKVSPQVANGIPPSSTVIYNNKNAHPSFSQVQNSEQIQPFHSNIPLPTNVPVNTIVQSSNLPGIQVSTSSQSSLSSAHQQSRSPFNVSSGNFTDGTVNPVPGQYFNQLRNGEVGSQVANGAPPSSTVLQNSRNVPSFSQVQSGEQMQPFYSNVSLPTNTTVQSSNLPGVQAPTSYQSTLSNAHQQGRSSSSSNAYFNDGGVQYGNDQENYTDSAEKRLRELSLSRERPFAENQMPTPASFPPSQFRSSNFSTPAQMQPPPSFAPPEQARFPPMNSRYQPNNQQRPLMQPQQMPLMQPQQMPLMQSQQMPLMQSQQMPLMQSQQMPFMQSQQMPPTQSQQTSQKLDPDMVPNPIQVVEEDRDNRGNEVYQTYQTGNQVPVVPPLVTTNFIVHDTGNTSPRFIRSTLYSVPQNNDIMKQANIPFGLIISPLAKLERDEMVPPVVHIGSKGPVRCVRCKAYMSPFMQFSDGGRKFHCCLCKATTDVTDDFQHLDHTGQRVDRYERPEMLYGAYEFTVPKEYCRDNLLPEPPILLFLIDVSYTSMKSGMVKVFCREIRNVLRLLPINPATGKCRNRVGFVTYSNNIQFYNLDPSLGRPQALIVNDVEDVFLPILNGFICDPYESDEMIANLMNQIPEMFYATKVTDTLLAPVIIAALQAFKVLNAPGKIYVFHSSLPTLNCYGKLVYRDDRQLLGTEKEKTILSPRGTEYIDLGKQCVKCGASVDLFVFNNSFIDLPTIGQLSRITGGDVYKYTYFEEEGDGPRFIRDLSHNISRHTVFDAVMKVRTSTGIRPINCYGVPSYSSTYDIEFGSINENMALAVEIGHDDKLTENEPVHIQVALLYTSYEGERRVRVLNLSLKVCTQLADLFRNCELDALINFYSKSLIHKLADNPPRQVKEALTLRCAHLLATYRKTCASPSSPGQLILPECIKLLPLYANCVLKSDAIAGGPDITVDERWLMMYLVSKMNILSSVVYFYPRMFSVTKLDLNSNELPKLMRCTVAKINNGEAYVLENGYYMFLWIGSNIDAEWLRNIFGVDKFQDVNSESNRLPLLDNPYSKKLHSILDLIQSSRDRTLKRILVRENDRADIVFRHFLVEDCSSGNSMYDGYSVSYIDYLCYMHKEIRNIIGG